MGIILAGFLAAALVVGLIFAYVLFSKSPPESGIVGPLGILAVVCVIGGFIIGITEPTENLRCFPLLNL